MKNKKKLIIIATMALLIIFGSTAYAYITTQKEGFGQFNINMTNANIQISKNQIQNNQLNVELKNNSEEEQYVRVKIVAPDFVSFTSTSTYWVYSDDGYWYYNNVIESGEKSSVLQLKINLQGSTDKNFKIVTNVESTTAMYDKDGKAYSDWQFTYSK